MLFRSLQCAEAGGAGTKDEHSILWRYLRYTGSPITCGENITYKKSLLIADAIGYAVQALIGQRYAHIFSLTTVDSAAKSPAAMLRLAVVDISTLTEKAFPAKGLYVDGYTVTYLDIANIRATSMRT